MFISEEVNARLEQSPDVGFGGSQEELGHLYLTKNKNVIPVVFNGNLQTNIKTTFCHPVVLDQVLIERVESLGKYSRCFPLIILKTCR